MQIPTLTTARLILRGPQESDFDAFAVFGASERSKWVDSPYSRPRSWGGFLGMFGHWALRGYGFWMLENKSNHTVARHLGLTGVISHIAHANTRSLALATRLGATFERDGELLGTPLPDLASPASGYCLTCRPAVQTERMGH